MILASAEEEDWPNAGSDTLFDQPTRARKRSSERIAIAFTKRMDTSGEGYVSFEYKLQFVV